MTMKLICLLLLISLAKGYQQYEIKSTVAPTTTENGRLNSGNLLHKDRTLSPVQAGEKDEDDNGLIEVKEDEIPEGTEVYVLEEPEDQPENGEIMKTANNIVFRPLFRYRGKQEALRRNYNNRVRRRYYIPRRSYRRSPYYYPYRYY